MAKTSVISGVCEVCGGTFIRKFQNTVMPYNMKPTVTEAQIAKEIMAGHLGYLALMNRADLNLAMGLICPECWPARWGQPET